MEPGALLERGETSGDIAAALQQNWEAAPAADRARALQEADAFIEQYHKTHGPCAAGRARSS